uniref:Ras-GAP domain-containing protein n=1 Tax=Meloidogyne hapla TaxID=6305 RepID=A0A1I8BH83_MELHA
MACAVNIEQDEPSSCSSSVSSSSSKVPHRFQPSRSPINRSSLAGLPSTTPYLGPSLSPVSSPQWRLNASGNSPGATATRAIPKSALLMSKILNSRSAGMPNLELMQNVSEHNILERTILDPRSFTEQSSNDKVGDLSYQRSPNYYSPSLGPLILRTEVDDEKDDEIIEMKTTECIFNFEDIFENETMEKEELNEDKNEFKGGREEDSELTEPVVVEELGVLLERKDMPSSEAIMEKEEIKQNENEMKMAINTKKERKANEEKSKARSSTGKKNRRETRRKSREAKKEKTKEDGENNEIEFLNKLEKEVPSEVAFNFVLTAQDLTAHVERIIFTSLSESCLLQIMSTEVKEKDVEGEMKKLKKADKASTVICPSASEGLDIKNKISFHEKEIRPEKSSNKEKEIKEDYLVDPSTDRPNEERKEKGKKGKSSKRKGKKYKDAGRKPPHLLQSIDLQNNCGENETEDMLTSPCSTASSPPALPSSSQTLVRRDEQSTRQTSSSIGRMIGRWRHTTGGIQLRNITFSGVWEKFALGIRSDGREALQTSSVQLSENRSDVNTLFRSQSLASKVMYEMMKCVGHKYLVVTLMPLIDLIFAERKSCEIDPSKIRPGESLDQNFHSITVYAELAFSRVVDSSQRCPPALRQLFAELRDVVEQFFPGRDGKNVGRLALSSFLILRFFAAAILNPKLFALKMATPDVNVSRTLVLVSKILQRIANCVVSANPPTIKEQWLAPVMDQFSDEAHNKAMTDFLDEISTSFTGTEDCGDNANSGDAVLNDESQVDAFSSTNISAPGMDIEKELHIVYSQISDHLDTLCSMGWCCRYGCSCCSGTVVQ